MKININDNGVSASADHSTRHNENISEHQSVPPFWFSKRMSVTVVMFFCLMSSALIRNNINIAIVEMTSDKLVPSGNTTMIKPAQFHWDSTTIGVVLSTLSYGGIFSFLAGPFIQRFGGSTTFAVCMGICGVMTWLHPYILHLHFYLFIVWRLATGLFESFTAASCAEIVSQWFPKKERSRLIAYSFNGMHIGVAITYPLCGYIAHSYGWQMVFHFTGILALLWSINCKILVKNQPSESKCISQKELEYILQETDRVPKEKAANPYKKILSSGPVWVLCFTRFTYMWIYTVVAACLPLYVKDMTQKSTKDIGYISFIPNIIYILMFPVVGTLMDYCKNHSNATETLIHKTVAGIVLISGSVIFLCAAILSRFFVSLILFSVIQILMSFMTIVMQTMTVSMAPNNSGAISGLSNSFKELGSAISRTITGYMVLNHSVQEWNNCFLLAAGILLLNVFLFLTFGSSEPQPWSLPADIPKKSDNV